ncbi:hypothetical protein YC2023_066960 [Brassica napus]
MHGRPSRLINRISKSKTSMVSKHQGVDLLFHICFLQTTLLYSVKQLKKKVVISLIYSQCIRENQGRRLIIQNQPLPLVKVLLQCSLLSLISLVSQKWVVSDYFRNK